MAIVIENIYVIYGAPLSGKSTLGVFLTNYDSAIRFSVRSWYAKLSQNSKDQLPPVGAYLPNEVLYEAINSLILYNRDASTLVFDGFPANAEQYLWLKKRLMFESDNISWVYIDIEYDMALKRALNRRVCVSCDGGVDQAKTDDNKTCIICGNDLNMRSDDTERGIQERWKKWEVWKREIKLL